MNAAARVAAAICLAVPIGAAADIGTYRLQDISAGGTLQFAVGIDNGGGTDRNGQADGGRGPRRGVHRAPPVSPRAARRVPATTATSPRAARISVPGSGTGVARGWWVTRLARSSVEYVRATDGLEM